MGKKIELFDSTLRDGVQGEGISFSVEDKLSIVRALDQIGISYIEAGNPGSNPKDMEFFGRAAGLALQSARLCAFGSTRRCGAAAGEDENVLSLLRAGTPVVAIFGKASRLHVTRIIRTTLQENLAMIRDTVALLKQEGREVVFDAEHFFDGYKESSSYALAALKAACEGGADVLCLCDTNGGSYVTEIYDITREVVQRFGKRTAIHCHNDTGLAVACSMAAVEAGAAQVQGTFIGFGERCGNADLATVLANLQLKRGYSCIPPESLPLLTPTARGIAEIANLTLPHGHPYVGAGAFAHKGGMHIDGVSKLPRSFEHIPPEAVGNERRFLLSEVSGRSTVLALARKVEPALGKDSPQTKAVVQRVKELEHAGYQFEGAQATVELLIRKVLGYYEPTFHLEQYSIQEEQPSPEPRACATAVIKVRVGERTEITAAQGDGPVHALDCALKKALAVFYPSLRQVRLTDYKVRVLEPQNATASAVRVLIETSDGEETWTTVGVSSDVIEASWIALVDSIEYKLLREQPCGASGAVP